MANSPDKPRVVADSNVIIAAKRSTHAQSPDRELIARWRWGEFDFLFSYDEDLLDLAEDYRATFHICRPLEFLAAFHTGR